MRIITLGINFLLSVMFRISLLVFHINLNDSIVDCSTKNLEAFNVQLCLSFLINSIITVMAQFVERYPKQLKCNAHCMIATYNENLYQLYI